MTPLVLWAGGLALRRWGRDWARYGTPVIITGWLYLTCQNAAARGVSYFTDLLYLVLTVTTFLLAARWFMRTSAQLLRDTLACPCGETLTSPQELADHRRVMHPNDTEETP